MATNQNITQLTPQTGSADPTTLLYSVVGNTNDRGLPLSVFVNNLGLTGVPTAPTPGSVVNTTQIITGAYAATYYAPLASPTFTGTVTIPSGASISGYLTTPVAAATYAALTGATFTGAIKPSTTSGIVGTTLSDNANAGSVGEFITGRNTAGSTMTANTATQIAGVTLTAGDWDVTGNLVCTISGGGFTQIVSAINTSVALPASALDYTTLQATFTTGASQSVPAASIRLSLSTSTTVSLVGQVGFTAGTATCTGKIEARRRR